ncbi:hypothetical protein SAMN04487907_102197 [Zunongwangia mangrovi]|uniref:Uncharacterized protein n=1 Tax=Zunongwangia mangrovi TaxID=1334022 RepID=A0A1I1GBC6_9FLAO|nr:hypothetical protein [Zunongwangia mangrovi]SFC08871.1 hypothetical protein SAMN04487907_102197 [Zunongwangia mangrovi]
MFIENWIGEHELAAKVATFVFFTLSYSLFYAEYGLVSGLIILITVLSVMLSLLILGRPLKTPKLSVLVFIFLVSLFSEIFI